MGKYSPLEEKTRKDAPLVGETLQKNSPSQLWQLKKSEPDAVALYNPFAELAVDLAIKSNKGPLLWSLDVTNPNQQLILEPEGNNFRLRAASYQHEELYLAVTSGGKGDARIREDEELAVQVHRNGHQKC